MFLLALLPGIPVGLVLFGRRHAAGWLAGALLGYGFTAAALWAALEVGASSRPALLAVWACLVAPTAPLWRARTTLVTLPRWQPRDSVALLLVLLLVPALVGLPFSRIGERDPNGDRLYRSYFTADFVWHMALTAELSQLRLPPRDPYSADQPLHYYWSYFLLPSVSTAMTADGPDHVSTILRVNALGAGLLFVGVIFLLAHTAVPSAVAAAGGVAAAVVASSAEGAFAIWRLYARGAPLGEVRNLNIDAISMWHLQGLTIDGLPRALWYTPQHAMACAFGLVALVIAAAGGVRTRATAALAAGTSLGLAVLFSPFLGGLWALVFGLAMMCDALRTWPPDVRGLLRQALSIVPFGIAVFVCAAAGVLEGAGGALRIGPTMPRLTTAAATIAATLGPVLLLALPALPRVPRQAALIPAACGLLVGLLVFELVSLGGTDPFWVGWRAGNVILVTIPGLIACTLAQAGAISRSVPRRVAIVAVLVAAIIGVPTTAIDAYNAQDTGNRGRAPGYSWTLTVTPDQQAGYDWIRRMTPRRAIVQMEPTSRGREGWTAIPSFAQRAMAGGLPISLVLQPYHREHAAAVRRIYETADAKEAWELARGLRIDFLYLDRMDRAAFPAAVLDKFASSPAYFAPAYSTGETAVYAVLR